MCKICIDTELTVKMPCAEFHIKVEINIADQDERRRGKKIFEKHDFENFYGAVFGHLSLRLLRLSALLFAFLCVDSS